MCLLCKNLNQRETYPRRFSDCPTAKRLWDFIRPLQDRLHADPEGDQRPARLLGDISTHWRLTAGWNEEAPPPPVDRFTKLVRGTWTEIRAVVLKAIWDARCDLHNNTTTRAEAIALALATVKSSLRVLAYQKLPSLLPGTLKPRPQGDLPF